MLSVRRGVAGDPPFGSARVGKAASPA